MKRVKIAFPCEGPSGAAETETMWAVVVDDGYEIDNIPFYAMEVACGDVVAAQSGPLGDLIYTGLVRVGGHSVVRLSFFDAARVPEVRDLLRGMGCSTEISDVRTLLSVDVPPEVPYVEVRRALDLLQNRGVLDYEEACLAHQDAALDTEGS